MCNNSTTIKIKKHNRETIKVIKAANKIKTTQIGHILCNSGSNTVYKGN